MSISTEFSSLISNNQSVQDFAEFFFVIVVSKNARFCCRYLKKIATQFAELELVKLQLLEIVLHGLSKWCLLVNENC